MKIIKGSRRIWIRKSLNKKTNVRPVNFTEFTAAVTTAPPTVRMAESQLIRAFALTLVPSGPDQEVFSVSEGDEQTCSCFILFIS